MVGICMYSTVLCFLNCITEFLHLNAGKSAYRSFQSSVRLGWWRGEDLCGLRFRCSWCCSCPLCSRTLTRQGEGFATATARYRDHACLLLARLYCMLYNMYTVKLGHATLWNTGANYCDTYISHSLILYDSSYTKYTFWRWLIKRRRFEIFAFSLFNTNWSKYSWGLSRH